ncbi:uncharacterized protein LOC127081781 [Lathyrus oleraceus]|uniref:uncharacterized protein LOC127081781 n=1 Tax=Pisum sativum TaxID=3888 RepID=UPI0021CF04EB|nr:uncharacterized protein LOC127081781 [Pisum sativum]
MSQKGESSYNKHDGYGDLEVKEIDLTIARSNATSVNSLEANYSNLQLRASSCSGSKNAEKLGCSRLNDTVDRLREEEDIMMSMKGVQCSEDWYLDLGCSTHMTGRKDWFVKINRAMKNKLKFMGDTTLMIDGISDVLIMRRDGGHSLIKYVFYISGIKCNLLSIGQFLETG